MRKSPGRSSPFSENIEQEQTSDKIKPMRTKITLTIAALAVLLFAPSAKAAFTLTLANAIGTVHDGTPANVPDELGYLQNMIAWANTGAADGAATTVSGHTYTLIK